MLIKLRQEFQHQTTTCIFAALGLVAGLAWNDVIRSLIEFLFPLDQSSLIAKFIYATVITLLIVIITLILTFSQQKQK